MRQVNRQRIVKYINHRKSGTEKQRGVSNESIRKELNILKHLLRIAVKLKMLARNPFDDLEGKDWPEKGQERTRHLSRDEWPRILREVPVVMRPAVILCVNTGLRRGELMNLRWTDLNSSKGVGYLPKTKSGKPRWFHLSKDMIALIKDLPRKKDEPRVFWQFSPSALTVAFRRAVKRSGVADFHLHDLRHTFATQIRQQGQGHGLDALQKLLGHSDPRMTQRYAHLGDELLVQAASSIDGLFSGVLPAEDESKTVH
jgi:integrase